MSTHGEALASGLSPAARTRPRFRISDVLLLRVSLFVAFIGLWELGYRVGVVDKFFFSAPSLVAQVLAQQLASGTMNRHIVVTVQEALAGLVLGFAAGVVLGWVATQSRLLGKLIEPVLTLLNSVPRIVLAPLFIMWLGIGIGSKIALAFLLVFVVVFFAVSSGLREVPEVLVERLRILGAGPRDLVLHVYLPSVLAWVFSSLRITVGFAFTGAIVGEFVASSRGLGYLLNFALSSFNATLMMAAIFIIMAIIVLLFLVLERIENWATQWKRAGT